MTLILARASYEYGLHLSDSLVTGGQGPDPASNKTAILVARDAVVSLGYTGLAVIDGVMTDQWIASNVVDDEAERSRRPPTFRLRSLDHPFYVGPALQSLTHRLRDAFAREWSSIFFAPRCAELDRQMTLNLSWGMQSEPSPQPLQSSVQTI